LPDIDTKKIVYPPSLGGIEQLTEAFGIRRGFEAIEMAMGIN
jgi:hypothetical protein